MEQFQIIALSDGLLLLCNETFFFLYAALNSAGLIIPDYLKDHERNCTTLLRPVAWVEFTEFRVGVVEWPVMYSHAKNRASICNRFVICIFLVVATVKNRFLAVLGSAKKSFGFTRL